MDKDILAVITCQGQLILGELTFMDREKITLKAPRVLHQSPTPDGKGMVNSLIPYIGEPESVNLNRVNITLYYHPTELRLKNAYISATTGIELAKVVPFNPIVISKGGKLN